MRSEKKNREQKIKSFPTEEDWKDIDEMGEEFRRKVLLDTIKYERQLNQDESLEFLDQLEDVTDISHPPEIFEKILKQLKKEGKWDKKENLHEIGTGKEFSEEFSEEISIAQIYDRLPEIERRAYDIGRKKLAHPKRKKIMRVGGSVAMVFLCIFMASMSSEANRKYVTALWHTITGQGYSVHIESGTDVLGETTPEEKAYEKIKKELGVTPLKLGYKPEGLQFSSFTINFHMKIATMQYLYKNKMFNVFIAKDHRETSRNQIFDGKVLDTYEMEYSKEKYATIVEMEGENGEKSYIAEFGYNNTYYSVSSVIEKEIFTKVLNNIYF